MGKIKRIVLFVLLIGCKDVGEYVRFGDKFDDDFFDGFMIAGEKILCFFSVKEGNIGFG